MQPRHTDDATTLCIIPWIKYHFISDDSLAQKASELSDEDIAEFLERIGLKSSADIVRENNYTGDLINSNIDDDKALKEELHMTMSTERLRFRVLFKRMLSGTISAAVNAFPPNKIAEICRSVNSLKSYAQVTLCLYTYSYNNTHMYWLLIWKCVHSESGLVIVMIR